ncbi:FecR family protein [Dyadobacter sp. CY323]|uniref:FecR family protein n=1 Tax=Dyadobacter sp. CY323 TaxID=2907302 RepID=UPI001F170EAF|nr:FecR family protein [Dyadobacter sp. CY323]MCE6992937.1 FecR family protein [Dyadobacter sp. CY323]
MNNEHLKLLLEKYRSGECTPDELDFIHDWYNGLDGEDLRLSEIEKGELEEKIWLNMQHDLIGEGWKVKRSGTVYLRYFAGIAATLLLIAGFVIFQKDMPAKLTASVFSNEKEMVREVNSSDQLKKLVLMDGSVVTLTPRSTLTYPKEFADREREVTLEGDAFFEITKNPDRPFIVKKGKLVTKVLGTSFWIRSDEKSGTSEVAVVTGKVTVFEEKETMNNGTGVSENSILVIPNEKAVYNARSGEIQRSAVEIRLPEKKTVQVREMVADNLPLPEILGLFKVLYGVNVEIGAPKMAQCGFTGDLRNMQFYDALELLCKSVNATYESVEGRIVMNGEGCQ